MLRPKPDLRSGSGLWLLATLLDCNLRPTENRDLKQTFADFLRQDRILKPLASRRTAFPRNYRGRDSST
jgi:hypothetical protein